MYIGASPKSVSHDVFTHVLNIFEARFLGKPTPMADYRFTANPQTLEMHLPLQMIFWFIKCSESNVRRVCCNYLLDVCAYRDGCKAGTCLCKIPHIPGPEHRPTFDRS